MVNLNSPMEIAMRDMTRLIDLANSKADTIPDVINANGPMYGAKPGAADNTAALQKAIDAAKAAGRSEVYLSPGHYDYTSLTNTNGIVIVGDGVTLSGSPTIPVVSTAQLADIAINVLANGVKPEEEAGSKINELIAANDQKVLFFPKAVYYIGEPLVIDNECCLWLDVGAELRCVENMTNMIVYKNYSNPKIKRFIKGGVFDGNGKANNVIHVTGCANLKISDTVIKNGIDHNLLYDSSDIPSGTSYELHVDSVLIDNQFTYDVNPNVVGIGLHSGDAFIKNVVIRNVTVGIDNRSQSNMIDFVHIWGNEVARLPHTIGITTSSVIRLSHIYFDSCWIGLQQSNNANVYLQNCIFFIPTIYDDQVAEDAIFFDNPNGYILVTYSSFLYYNTNKKVVLATDESRIRGQQNIFSTPFNSDSEYAGNSPINLRAYRLTVSGLTVPANGAAQATFAIPGIDYNHLYIFQNYGNADNGVIVNCILDEDLVRINFRNVTASDRIINNDYGITFFRYGLEQLPITQLTYPGS